MTHPNAHLPVTAQSGQYRLGRSLSASASDIWWNTADGNGVLTTVGEPEGWEGIEYVTPIDTVGGRDGGVDGPQSIAPRVLAISGVMVAGDAGALRRKIRAVRAMLAVRQRVVWDQFDFGVAIRMGLVCRAQGDFKATPLPGTDFGGVATRIDFTLVAANPPWKFATDQVESIDIGLPSGVVSGRTYSKTYNYNYGAVTNPGGQANAVNRGDIDTWPVYVITGPVDNPIITNETTGRSFLVVGTIAALATVTIDSRTGVVTPPSTRLVGRPFPLVPGVNSIRWRASSGSFDPNANLRLTWRSTWE